MAAELTWTEVRRVEWQRPKPPHPLAPPGTDYGVSVFEQTTWPDDGTTCAGRVYERCTVWQGPSPQYRMAVIVSMSGYPACAAAEATG